MIIIIKIMIIIINEIEKKPKRKRYNFITNGNWLIKNLGKKKGKKIINKKKSLRIKLFD